MKTGGKITEKSEFKKKNSVLNHFSINLSRACSKHIGKRSQLNALTRNIN